MNLCHFSVPCVACFVSIQNNINVNNSIPCLLYRKVCSCYKEGRSIPKIVCVVNSCNFYYAD